MKSRADWSAYWNPGRTEPVQSVTGWTRESVDSARVTEAPALGRVVVGVKPGMSGHTTGVVVAGRSPDGHYYVLGDHSIAADPSECVQRMVGVYRHYRADLIAGVVNEAGYYLERLLRTADASVQYKVIHTMRDVRPSVAALYEQGCVHHVGTLASLEERMSSWTPYTYGTESRVSALAAAIIGLKGEDA